MEVGASFLGGKDGFGRTQLNSRRLRQVAPGLTGECQEFIANRPDAPRTGEDYPAPEKAVLNSTFLRCTNSPALGWAKMGKRRL